MRVLDRIFGVAANPLRNLGALGFLLFWVLAASGIYLYRVTLGDPVQVKVTLQGIGNLQAVQMPAWVERGDARIARR